MNRLLAVTPVVGATHSLAINGHNLSLGHGKDSRYRREKALFELLWVQPCKDTTKGVMLRNPMFQFEKLV